MPERRVYRVKPSALYRSVRDEGILLQLDSGEYFGLDAVAHRMWQLIVEFGDLDEVAARLEDEFDVDPARLTLDLDGLVQQLVGEQLLERVEPGPDR